jgi:GntR family transcriptional regulator, transcriptional repressor for pyruvate dehydrogenase complex
MRPRVQSPAVGPHDIAFQPIPRETLSAAIRERLAGRIASGELEPGARMPSERLLSEQFAVARTSVREAMQGLLSLGVIERRGNRSYVAEQLPDIRLGVERGDDRKTFVRQLFETRRVLELPITRLAAARATADDRAEIAELAKGFRRGMALDEFRAQDRRFHAAISRAAGNPLLVEVYGKVMGQLFRSDDFAALLPGDADPAEVTKIVNGAARHHAAIARAIGRGDPDAAVAAGTRHLDDVERRMIDRLV